MSYGAQIEVESRGGLATAETPPEWGDQGVYRTLVADTRTRVRIHTLGRFSVAIDGRQLCSEGKARQRPLALLKSLIALGGRSVGSSHIWECLWPDSEGDLAMRNLTVTLHRLRHLLGTNASILQHDGKLTLNDRVCWVDVWSFERAANEGLRGSGERTACDAASWRLREALDLYTGHFLARESEESWMLAARLRLKIKFERLIAALLARLENAGTFVEAIDLCLQALEHDPLNETLHRSLMSCYLKSGEPAEALRAYARCREALERGLDAVPSAQTQRLYLEAMQASRLSDLLPASRHLPGTVSAAACGRRDVALAHTNRTAL